MALRSALEPRLGTHTLHACQASAQRLSDKREPARKKKQTGEACVGEASRGLLACGRAGDLGPHGARGGGLFAATDVPGAWLRGYAYEAGTKRLGYVTRPVHCIALQKLIMCG